MHETESGPVPGGLRAPDETAGDQSGEPPSPSRGTLWIGWRGIAAAVLLTLFVVFAVLDIARLLSPKQGQTTTTPIIIVAGGSNGPPAGAPLRLSPATVTLHCQSSAQLTLMNTSVQPASWAVQTLPSILLLDANTPSRGTLGSGQVIVLTLHALGPPGGATFVVSDGAGNQYSTTISVVCP
jgi:hypothetical protein